MSSILNYLQRDPSGELIEPTIILCKRSGERLGVIPYTYSFTFLHNLNDADEISFSVTKYADGKLNPMWDDILDLRLVYIPEYSDESGTYNPWFEIKLSDNEDNNTVKSVQGTHVQEAELSQLMLFNTEINTEDDIARDDYTTPTIFYNPTNTDASLIHRVLHDKAPHYTIHHIDESLRKIQRTFSFDGKSIKDALSEIGEEVDCIFVFGEGASDNGEIQRTISAYDLEDYCLDCGERGIFDGKCSKCGSTNIREGYGEDTNVFVSTENLADSVTYENDIDSVKNCFKLTAGDDLMTATVRNINPNGSSYIYYITPQTRSEMSTELQDILTKYDKTYAEYETDHEMTDVPESAVNAYNTLINKYKSLNDDLATISYPIKGHSTLIQRFYEASDFYAYLKTTLCPDGTNTKTTTAAAEVDKLTSGDMSPIGVAYDVDYLTKDTADATIKSLVCVYADAGKYKVAIESSSFTCPVWTGKIRLTNYVDDDDTAVSNTITIRFNENRADYIKRMIERASSLEDKDNIGITVILEEAEDQFKLDLKHFSLDYLKIFQSACTAMVNIMIEQGTSESSDNLYSSLYLPYYNKMNDIEKEIAVRESELAVIQRPDNNADRGLIDYINIARKNVAATLSLKDYINNDDLWAEFCSFRREDEYNNSNYISTGLSNASLIFNAKEFMKRAQNEIIKSATMQNTITGELKDFLLMPEFADIKPYFQTGNWIHLEVDGSVYKLRIKSIKINYDDLDKIDVEFTNVISSLGTINDLQSILDQAQGMATSYSYIAAKATRGDLANQYIDTFVNRGLDLTQKKIVNSATDQAVTFDEHGLLCRRKDNVTDAYYDEQTKIINNGIYYTTDAWKTTSAALGHFIYYDPETGKESDKFGVIADTIVGNLILGKEVGIYNKAGTLKFTDIGIVVTSKKSGSNNENLITIRRDNEDGTYSTFMKMEADGSLKIGTDSVIDDDGTTLTSIITKTSDAIAAEVTRATTQEGVLSSSIKQNADNISLLVTDGKANGASIVAAINNNSSSVTINADKINLSGYVTFRNLRTSGSTYINADNIKTGTINADNVTITNLDADNITSGTITSDRIRLNGLLSVYTASSGNTVGGYIGYGYGSTGSQDTYGIIMQNGGNYGSYVFCSWAGAILKYGSTSVLCTSAGVHLTGTNINLDGTVYGTISNATYADSAGSASTASYATSAGSAEKASYLESGHKFTFGWDGKNLTCTVDVTKFTIFSTG